MELMQLGPAGGARRYVLVNGETIIGRRPDCRIVLDAPSIRYRHARLFSVDGSTVIHAIDDAWPVYVNGEPVERRMLADGDDIELGPYRMRYLDKAEPGPTDDVALAAEPESPAAGNPHTDVPDHARAPALFAPADDDPTSQAPEPLAAAHDDSEDAAPLTFDPVTFTDAASEHQTVDEDEVPPAADEADLQWDVDEVHPQSASTEMDLPWATEEIDLQPAADAPRPAPATGETAPHPGADEPAAAPAPGFHLDILTGINQGRRVALTRDIVVLGFNQQRLVEMQNEDGALSLRRIDDEAVAHLNGLPIPDEPTEARPGDVISLQRIELRIHQG